jgi:hypothetical protein
MESVTSDSRIIRVEKPNKGPHGQLVINVSRVGSQAAEKVETTEAARQVITQCIKNVERLVEAALKDFCVWRANNSTNIKFSVEKDKEAALRQTTTQ